MERMMMDDRRQDNRLARDLDHILAHTEGLWDELRGARLFITGGTGFFGSWFLESLLWANKKLDLKASALVLSRSPAAFRKKLPHVSDDPAITFQQGDVRDFTFPEGYFSHIIHAAATSAVATFNNEDPLVKFDTLVEGTRRTLEFAARCSVKKFMLTSSGAVYGRQPADMTHVPEDYAGAPDLMDSQAVWGEAKRAAELLSACYSRIYGFDVTIARCFSFVGPYLPLDIHYAIGNFIRDALNGGPVVVAGDGTPYRSYLYAADLMIWLWTILFRGESCCPYNVGSEAAVTIAELAERIVKASSSAVDVMIAREADPNAAPQRYVPSVARARESLGLQEHISLDEAIARTISYAQTIHI